MKSKKATYKNLLIKFTCQFLVVVLTLNIGASIILAFEYNGEQKLSNNSNVTREERLREFSKRYNVSTDVLNKFLDELDDFEDNNNRSMSYVESLLLVISIFFTIGWGHIVPITGWGRLVSIISALLGIPLSFLFIHSGSKILLKLVEDILQIFLSYNNHNRNKYGDTKIKLSAKKNLIPTITIILCGYFFSTTYIIATLEGFSYAEGLWYSFITLTTIGLGDLVQGNAHRGNDMTFSYAQVLLTFLWLVFGYIIIGTFMMISFAYAEKTNLKEVKLEVRESNKNRKNLDGVEETSFLCPNEGGSAKRNFLPFNCHPILSKFSRK